MKPWSMWLVGSPLLLLLGTISGCAESAPIKVYVPPESAARAALRLSLEAWKAARPAGELPDAKPAVYVTDSRQGGRPLEDFEILGETPGSAGRTYAVSLRLGTPAEELRTRYLVVGIDPLWVFQYDDYEMMMHWDHPMPPPGTTPANKADAAKPSAGDGSATAPTATPPRPTATSTDAAEPTP